MAKHRCAEVIFDHVDDLEIHGDRTLKLQYYYCLAPATKVKSGLYFCDDHFEGGVGFEY